MKSLKSILSATALLVGVVTGTQATAATIYTAVAVPFAFTDISGTGTAIAGLTGVDDAAVSVPIGFSFGFYGTSYSSVFVSSNGLLTFGSGDSTFTNADLTTSPTEAAIAVFWDDLFITGSPGSKVFTQTLGPIGSQQFIIQWDQVTFFSGGASDDTLTFEAILSEGSNDILFSYSDLVSGSAGGNNGASATVGIKDVGVQGPDRLLLAFNNGPNNFVGALQSTLITADTEAVPEPATLALLGLGILGLGVTRRRKAS